MTGWEVAEQRGTAQELHDLDVPAAARRTVWICRPTGPALVLGSTQPDSIADADALAATGVALARRRSGGGAVLLDHDTAAWIDVVVPRGDPLWSDDVAVAAHWLGDAWAAALGALGVTATAHRGPLQRRPWSDAVCFAGLGPGEATVAGRKVVGVSQRRTRAGARFQTVAIARWRPARLLDLLSLAPPDRLAAEAAVAPLAVGLEPFGAAAAERVVDALLAALP